MLFRAQGASQVLEWTRARWITSGAGKRGGIPIPIQVAMLTRMLMGRSGRRFPTQDAPRLRRSELSRDGGLELGRQV